MTKDITPETAGITDPWAAACRDPRGWPAGRQFRERAASQSRGFGTMSVQGTDRISKVKVWDRSRELWRDLSNDDYGPFIIGTSPGDLAAPSQYRTILKEYEINCPEQDKPDYLANGKGVIPSQWSIPRKTSNKHASRADELAVMLDYYHMLRDSNEQIQTNFFIGDNDNAPLADNNGRVLPPLFAAGEWEIRPSVKAMMRAVSGVKWNERPAFADSLGNHRPAMVVPIEGPDVKRDETSRTVTEIERESALAVYTARMPAKYGVEYAKKNKPSYAPPISRLGTMYLATTDFDPNVRDSKRRGELLEANRYRPRDGALAPKRSSAGQEEEDSRRRAELSRVMTGASPANDNQSYTGLPWRLWDPDYLVPDATPTPLANSPEDFLIANESRERFCAAMSALSADELQVVDSFLSAENFAQVGRETGDDGKHERTQEKNGQRRALQVSAKLTTILGRNAA